jgi:predicted hotdog family 3-hydroxylacyl-ACP dehydratase
MNYERFVPLPVVDLLPHKPPMALLERTVEIADDYYEAELSIKAGSMFCENGKVGAWLGLEYMAQAIAAFAGAESLARNEAVKVGFLLGTREYKVRRPDFPVGITLRVRVKKVIHETNGLNVLEGQIRDASSGEILAEAMLNCYQVADIDAYLRERG